MLTRRAGLLALTIALSLLPVTSYSTHYGGEADGGHPVDTGQTLWWTTTLTTTWVNIVNWNRTNNVDPTIFNTLWVPDHDLAETAIWNEDLPDPFVGFINCVTLSGVDTNQCLHAHIRYDHVYPLNLSQQRSVGCHELGHMLALGHRLNNNTTSCMQSPFTNFPLYYDNHDKSEIDSHNPPGYLNGQHVY